MTSVASFICFQCRIVCMSHNNLLIRLSFIGHDFWILVLLETAMRCSFVSQHFSTREVEGSTPRMCMVKAVPPILMYTLVCSLVPFSGTLPLPCESSQWVEVIKQADRVWQNGINWKPDKSVHMNHASEAQSMFTHSCLSLSKSKFCTTKNLW